MTKTLTLVLSQAVGDFDDDFDAAQTKVEPIFWRAADGVLNALGMKAAERVRLARPVFQDFDSGNPAHAMAYFHVLATGPDDIIDRLTAHVCKTPF